MSSKMSSNVSSMSRTHQRAPTLHTRFSSGFDLTVLSRMQNTRLRYNRAILDSRSNSRSSRVDSILNEDFESGSKQQVVSFFIPEGKNGAVSTLVHLMILIPVPNWAPAAREKWHVVKDLPNIVKVVALCREMISRFGALEKR
ncbi:hypothetical protein PoB_001878000 [Plakobranchus ocellatus]|uniref:Uncharacterized protein n=1 Tax=Plakobranchus ocellatus TaxID=259542 RepID=A0AAV3ZCI2_9GAST|nr:hypothetical protein PoB_001878000 [Plakobranchus ocellatus]